MKLPELRRKIKEFTKVSTQAAMSVIRADIKESYLKGEILEKTKDNLLKELYGIATMNGLFVLQAKMEAKVPILDEEEEEYEEESYEESYSYSYDEEEENEEDENESEEEEDEKSSSVN